MEEDLDRINEIRTKILGAQEKYGGELGIIDSKLLTDGILRSHTRNVGTKAEYELAKEFSVPFGVVAEDDFYSIAPNGRTYEGGREFISEDRCTSQEDIKMIQERRARLEELKKLLEESPEKFEQQGRITVKGDEIPMTQRELIEAGFDPEVFGWKSLEQIKDGADKRGISSRDISEASLGLPKRVLETIRGFLSRERDSKNNERGE